VHFLDSATRFPSDNEHSDSVLAFALCNQFVTFLMKTSDVLMRTEIASNHGDRVELLQIGRRGGGTAGAILWGGVCATGAARGANQLSCGDELAIISLGEEPKDAGWAALRRLGGYSGLGRY
jgi:hypothetical protein